MDSKRIAICKEFQPALLKIASSQFLGGSRLSGSVVKANWRAAFLTRTVSVQENTPWEPLGHVPLGNSLLRWLLPGREHLFFSGSSAGGGCPQPIPLTKLRFLFRTKMNPASSSLQYIQTSQLGDAFKTRDTSICSWEFKVGGSSARGSGRDAAKGGKPTPRFSENRFKAGR